MNPATRRWLMSFLLALGAHGALLRCSDTWLRGPAPSLRLDLAEGETSIEVTLTEAAEPASPPVPPQRREGPPFRPRRPPRTRSTLAIASRALPSFAPAAAAGAAGSRLRLPPPSRPAGAACVRGLPRLPQVCVADALSEFARFAQAAAFAGVGVLAVAAAVLLWRRWLLAERTVKTAVTWDCGYVAPTARMQYTASSYMHPVTRLLGSVLPEHHDEHPPAGVLPRNATFVTYHPDPCREWFFAPLFRRAYRLSMVLHRVQLGSIQLYIAYIAITLLILMVWQLG